VTKFNPLRYGGWIGNFVITNVSSGANSVTGVIVDDLDAKRTDAIGQQGHNYKFRFPANYVGGFEVGDILTVSIARKNPGNPYEEEEPAPEKTVEDEADFLLANYVPVPEIAAQQTLL
jgi:hypothetical protein